MITAVAERTGVDRVIVGSYVRAGDAIRINVRLQDAKTGRIESSERVEGANTSALFGMVDDLSKRIRVKFDRLQADTNLLTRPGAEKPGALNWGVQHVATSSIEAYRLYVDGLDFQKRFRYEEAKPLFERAIRIDPGFASAYSKLASVEGNLGHFALREKYSEMAFRLADRVTPVERAHIEGVYYARKVATRARAVEAHERCIQLDPGHEPCRINLASIYVRVERYEDVARTMSALVAQGSTTPITIAYLSWAYHAMGQLEKGLAVTQQALKAHPESSAAHRNFAISLNSLGRHDEALQSYSQARLLDPTNSTNDYLYMVTQFLREDWSAAAAIIESNMASPDETRRWQGGFLSALVHWRNGRSVAGIAASEKAASAYKFAGQRAFYSFARSATAHMARGDAAAAFRAAERAAVAARGADEEAEALVLQAWALAAADRHQESEAIVARLTSSIEAISAVRDRRNVSFAKGLVSFSRGDLKVAIANLLEVHATLSPSVQNTGILAPHAQLWSLLGQALYNAGRSAEAMQWFKKLSECTIEHIYDPIDYVRSFYFLGKIYEQQGDTAKSREAYRRFVGYWKDGDLDRDRIAEAQRKIGS